MSSDILFGYGDLLEYTRETKGEPSLPEEMAMRGIVMGFEVQKSYEDGEVSVSVWLYEGAQQPLGEAENKKPGDTEYVERETRVDKRYEMVSLDHEYLVSLEPKVVQRGNSPRELTNFMVGQ